MALEAALIYSDGIKGTNPIASRADSSEIFQVDHQVRSPVDSQTGARAGTRVHSAVTVVKPVDTASAPLFQALCQNQLLESLELNFYRNHPETGEMEMFWTAKMERAKVGAIRPKLPNTKLEESATLPFFEEIEFVYEKITWTHVDGFEFVDEWAATPV